MRSSEARLGRAEVRIPSGSLSLPDAVRMLDDAGIPVLEIARRQASLDDVFSALTRQDVAPLVVH